MDKSKWEYKKLGEVATFLNGYAFKPDDGATLSGACFFGIVATDADACPVIVISKAVIVNVYA